MEKHHGHVQTLLWRAMIVILYGLKALTNRNGNTCDTAVWTGCV
jgi:hypothetical protein